jgi:hypothetical protein
MLAALVVVSIAYINIWKHGVPGIFEGSDVSVSWNVWALIWSEGQVPLRSYGYPQLVPTIWAVAYIFTGSTEQYFAFYIYIALIIVPVVLNAMVLGRIGWWQPLASGFVFLWFVAEIREPWLRSTLEGGWPDWIAAFFAFCGTVLFVAGAPDNGRPDRAQIVTALLALWLGLLAAATKPMYGLVAIAILSGICANAARHLPGAERRRMIVAAVGLLSLFVVTYLVVYLQLIERSMPHYPVSDPVERFSRAYRLLVSNFTLPFRLLALTGLVLSPFLPRVRWLTVPLLAGLLLWANTASYDVRNILGLLMICAFIPVYALARRLAAPLAASGEPHWRIPDGVVAIVLAMLCLGLTFPLARDDDTLRRRFATEQMNAGLGPEINGNVERLLRRGCTVLSDDVYIKTISAFRPFLQQMLFFHAAEPTDLLTRQLEESTGCMGILYPPGRTHPSVLASIEAATKAGGLTELAERHGMVLVAPNSATPAKR